MTFISASNNSDLVLQKVKDQLLVNNILRKKFPVLNSPRDSEAALTMTLESGTGIFGHTDSRSYDIQSQSSHYNRSNQFRKSEDPRHI